MLVRSTGVGALVTMLVLSVASGSAFAQGTSPKPSVIAAVRAAGDVWRVATERADAEGVLSAYLDSPETTIIRSDQTVVSFAALRGIVLPEFRGIRSQEVRPRVRQIYPLGPTSAAESQVGSWTTTDTAGVVVAKEYALTRAWTQVNGRWQIVHSYMVVRPVRP